MFEVEAPDWTEHPVYASMLSDGQRLLDLVGRGPAGRSTSELAAIDIPALTSNERVDLLAVLHEQRNWLESIQLKVLAEMHRADRTKLGLSQEQVSAVLRVPLRAAQQQLATAGTMVRELPRTAALMAAGQLTGRHAQVLADAAGRLPPDLLGHLEDRVIDRAPDQTVPQFKQSVRRAVLALDPATAEQRHQNALADRRVSFQSLDDGLAQLSILLGAVEGQLIYTRLTAATGLLPTDDPRTMDQKRADLLVDAMLSGLPLDALPDVHGRKPSIQITVSADTLLELDDQPGHLSGYGPINAETARRFAADESGTWRRLLTDPDTGQLLDLDQKPYRPSSRLRDFVAARDGACCFPTCNQPGTVANTNTSRPLATAVRPVAATERWPANDTTSARSIPAGTTPAIPTGRSLGLMTPGIATPAGHLTGGRCRRAKSGRHRSSWPRSSKCTPPRISPTDD